MSFDHIDCLAKTKAEAIQELITRMSSTGGEITGKIETRRDGDGWHAAVRLDLSEFRGTLKVPQTGT